MLQEIIESLKDEFKQVHTKDIIYTIHCVLHLLKDDFVKDEFSKGRALIAIGKFFESQALDCVAKSGLESDKQKEVVQPSEVV